MKSRRKVGRAADGLQLIHFVVFGDILFFCATTRQTRFSVTRNSYCLGLGTNFDFETAEGTAKHEDN